MSIEAIKQMVHELEYVLDCINNDEIPFDGDDFHEALRLGRQAIAEAEKQEPDDLTIAYMAGLHDGKNKYAPQREWKSLTDDEIKEIVGSYGGPIKGYTRELFDKIEAKLREKNGG